MTFYVGIRLAQIKRRRQEETLRQEFFLEAQKLRRALGPCLWKVVDAKQNMLASRDLCRTAEGTFAEVILCSHCRIRPGEWCCTRLTEKYLRCFVRYLKPGDRVCRSTEWEPRGSSHATVVRVVPNQLAQRSPGNKYGRYVVSIAIERPNHPTREKTFDVAADATMRKAMPSPCQSVVCEVCAQDPGEPHRYCPEHWIRLESAA